MWCRAEQLCHALRNSTSNIYVATSAEGDNICKPLTAEEDTSWMSGNLHVFEGKCTMEKDRLALVPPLLGLYAQVIANKDDPVAKAVLDDITKDKDRVFPKTVEIRSGVGVRTGRKHEYELFGNLVEKLESMLETDQSLCASLRETSTLEGTSPSVSRGQSLKRRGKDQVLPFQSTPKIDPMVGTPPSDEEGVDAGKLTSVVPGDALEMEELDP